MNLLLFSTDGAAATRRGLTCIFCGAYDESFSDNGLDMHYWRACPMLTRCHYCRQVVEVASLTQHLLGECVASTQYRRCDRVQKPFRRRFSTTTLPPSRVHLANLNQLRITVPFAMRTYPPGTKAGEYTSCPDPTVALLILGHDLMPQRNRRRATRVLRCLPQEPRGATRGRLLWAGPLLRAGGVEYPARPLQALRERTPSREDGRGRARTSAGGLREWVETTPLFKDSRKLVTKRKRVREREEEREVERKTERKRRGKKLWTSENDLDRKVL
nr:uncharacterized protein LOC113819460 [Penaeus vannamei]